MGERKGTTVLLTVIGIATLLVALVGATFAYFTATVKDENEGKTNVTVTAATLGTVTFKHENVIDFCSDEEIAAGTTPCYVYPDETDEISFTVESSADSTVPVDYEIYLLTETNTVVDAANESNNLVATLTATSVDNYESLLSSTPLKTTVYQSNDTTNGVLIGKGTLKPGGKVDTWTLNVELLETGSEQNEDQGRIFKGSLKVVADTQYTANGAVYTTTTSGTAEGN